MAAKHTAAVSTQLIAAAQGAGGSNRNEASQSQLINHCQAVAEQISALVQSVRYSMANPDNPSAQLGLINSSQSIIPVSGCCVVDTHHDMSSCDCVEIECYCLFEVDFVAFSLFVFVLQPAAKMVAAAKAAMPTVGDQAAALQLGNFAKATASALAELKAASTKVSYPPPSSSPLHPLPSPRPPLPLPSSPPPTLGC